MMVETIPNFKIKITCNCAPEMHFISLLNNLVTIPDSNFPTSQTSKTSKSSVKNITSFGEFAKGQYLNNPSTSCPKIIFFYKIT